MTLVARPRELVELVVLSLLSEQPRHPYDMVRQVKLRGNAEFVPGLPRSLYHAVDRLVEAGFVQAGETVREGMRPERTVFAVTDDGRAEYSFRLQELVSTPSDPATFHAALSLIGGLPRETALFALRTRASMLEGEAAKMRAAVDGAVAQLPRLFLIEVEFLEHQATAEASWVRRLIDDVETGRLSWDIPEDFVPPDELPGPPR